LRTIYFRIDEELIYFCEKLFRIQNEIHVQWKRNKNWGNELSIMEQRVKKKDIISCFTEVLTYFRLNRFIKKIAHDVYYYTDVDEIERICEWTNWVLAENEYAEILYEQYKSFKDFITALLTEQIHSYHPIYFDSLVTFSMKPLQECLKLAVGYGIDEMKREEDYQNFIQSIREFILKRETKMDELHIVQGENFTFYKKNGKKYTTLELRALMHEEPLYLLGLDKEEMNLSPVITLLPKHIFIYGDYPTDPKTLALMSIFEERVALFPKEQFPFRLNVK